MSLASTMDVLDRPPSDLPLELQQDLLIELSIDSPTQRDWKGLADLLGFKAPHIRLLAQQSNEDLVWQARTVLERWEGACRRRGADTCTVRVLIYALAALELQNCVDELGHYLHGTTVYLVHYPIVACRYKQQDRCTKH